jgi:hypothetical protein
MAFFWGGENFVSLELFKKKWAFYLNVNPVKQIFENPNFLATRFVRLVLPGLKGSHSMGDGRILLKTPTRRFL